MGLQAFLPAAAVEAPCAPGNASVWAPAAKDFLGTALGAKSRVYFTGAEGILTEIFYPSPDIVQNVDLQFLVTDAAKTWGGEERRQKRHVITQIHRRAMAWQVVTTEDNNRWRITKRIFADPNRNAVIQRVTFTALEPGKTVKDYNVYLLNNPAIQGTGAGGGNPGQCGGPSGNGPDNSRTLSAGGRTMLVASEPHSTASALAVSLPWKIEGGQPMVSHGFVGRNDGFTDLFGGNRDQSMEDHFDGAFGGNVAQIGWIDFGGRSAKSISFDVVLAFGSDEAEAMRTANASLNSDREALENQTISAWVGYATSLNNQNGKADDQYYLAAMALKSIQDKENGAMIAGLGTPWGETKGDDNQGGYHLIWSRDLFKFASALIAAGDTASANKAVDYLFSTQMQTVATDQPFSRPGRFPQNTFVDGRIYWNGTQMDQTAMPIILAWKLNRVDLWPKVKRAAEFLAKNGPATEQERWEEVGGYSPSTIAAQVAGLVCAASLANSVGDIGARDFYLQKADEWRNNLANWTFTTTGFHGNGKYYLRITANQDPNDDARIELKNQGGTHGERWIIDGGFLELVRMGVMSPQDWTILETLPEYDAILKQTIPGKGDAWFRYNFDGYGKANDGRNFNGSGRGRLWPIFTAERGIYEIAKSRDGSKGVPYQKALKAFASSAGFIPEQVWNTSANITGWQTITPAGYEPGTATKSMQPLSWAMGEYINLIAAMNRQTSDAPSVVCQRYACDQAQTTVTFQVKANTVPGQAIYLVGNHPLLSNWIPASGIKLSPIQNSTWSVTVSLPANSKLEYKYLRRDQSGKTIWEAGPNRPLLTPALGAITQDDLLR